jgi:hypothetical protein
MQHIRQRSVECADSITSKHLRRAAAAACSSQQKQHTVEAARRSSGNCSSTSHVFNTRGVSFFKNKQFVASHIF